MKRPGLIATLLAAFLISAATAFAQSSSANIRQFNERCAGCHRNAGVPAAAGAQRAPDFAALQKMSTEAIHRALTTGPAAAHVQGVDANLKLAIAEFLGGRKLRTANATTAGRCQSNASFLNSASPRGLAPQAAALEPSWNGWGPDTTQARFQSARAAGLTAAQVPRLKLKWAFGFPDATSVYGQPTVVAGRVFIGVDTGYVYSLDAATGCVYWSFDAGAGVRNAINIGPIKGQRSSTYAAYFGDIRGNLFAVDASTGMLIWKVTVDSHPLATITGAPTLYRDRLYVPVASREEAAGSSPNYPCCTFRGSLVAIDAGSGRQVWKTHMVESPAPTKKNSRGVQLYGPSGVGVWASPSVDERRGLLYIATGDAYSGRAPVMSDAVLALDINTGAIRWVVQHTENDAWLVGCDGDTRSENCPEDVGPDYDFGSPPMMRTLPDGRTVLVSGQKSGEVYAQDAGREGAVIWKATLVEKLSRGEIVFGGGADDQTAYFGTRTGGMSALDLRTGMRKWFTPVPTPPGRRSGVNAALAVIPGVIFSGGWDGYLRAFAAEDGRIIWEFDTIRDFTTVNAVAAKGGSMGAPGPTIAGGMLFAGSGYPGLGAGMGGNVLLAFSAE
jgi:polyvinyl alcohol dehydrogenase (cytochrome)